VEDLGAVQGDGGYLVLHFAEQRLVGHCVFLCY
jgi:hypothetical protein